VWNKHRAESEHASERFRIKPQELSPEVLERRRAQLQISGRVLDRSMAEPIPNAPRVVTGVASA
jgi:hypothetical protein